MHALTISAFHYSVLRQRCKCEPLTHSHAGVARLSGVCSLRSRELAKMNLRHPKSAQNAQTDDQTGLEPPNSQATAPPATPGNTQRRASPGPLKPQVTESPYRHDKHGQTRTKMQVTKHRNTKPQVTASQTQPWGVTPRPATTGDAHANYHFSPRQLLARGSQSSLGLRRRHKRWGVVSMFEFPGWRAFVF